MMMHPPVSRASLPIPHQASQSRLEPVNSGLLYQNEIFEDVFQDAGSNIGRYNLQAAGSDSRGGSNDPNGSRAC